MENLIKRIVAFRDQRNWAQYHNPKDLALSVAVEAGELLELFQWRDSGAVVEGRGKDIRREIADVFIYGLLLCHELGINPALAVREKLSENAAKYPVKRASGSNEKYDRLDPS